MKTALALQVATFARSLTARVTTALLLVLPPLFSLGMVAIARSADLEGPSSAKLAPYKEGTFGQAAAALSGQVVPVTVIIGVGFAIAWLVGREWADRTIGTLFALPVSRDAIAVAKNLVVFAWAATCVTISMGLLAAGIAVLGDGSLDAGVWSTLARVWLAGLLMCGLAMPFGWVAVRFRGYLAAVGAIVGVAAASQILASLGAGAWVPYVAPVLWTGAAGPEVAASIAPASLALSAAFAAVGAWASVRAFATARLD